MHARAAASRRLAARIRPRLQPHVTVSPPHSWRLSGWSRPSDGGTTGMWARGMEATRRAAEYDGGHAKEPAPYLAASNAHIDAAAPLPEGLFCARSKARHET